ncbi:hypothetical protein GGR50DRAFT_675190 [Xylaria sp. CBS 124048]|nr:hypothetical protein GGR50DRAFT_675190 [Xylaria sp. CBS 124048]
MSSPQSQLAGMMQAAHLNQELSSRHGSRRNRRYGDDLDDIDIEDEDENEEDEEDIPLSVLVRPPRASRHPPAHPYPPMPDLRFEQSYLNSISDAQTWWRVAYITVRDQIMLPLAQGVLYNIAIIGWQHWNRNVQMSGSSAGARLRRWWYNVNKWPLPDRAMARTS